jgi:hypothetical protein
MTIFLIFLLIISEVSIILAHIGHFSLITVLVLSISFLFIFRKVIPEFKEEKLPFWLFPVLIIAGILFFQPYEYMDGGWDPGNYINTGVHIARTGEITYHDNYLKDTAGFVNSDGTGLKYPGLYIKDLDKGLVVPQFFHLFPVWIALFYKLFGLNSVFYVNPFFAILSLVLLFLIVQNIMGRRYAFLAAMLLCFNVVEIWNARFPTSEILGQFFLLAGFYFWMHYIKEDNVFFAFWSGFSFGEFLLTGVTSVLIIPLVFFYLLLRLKKRDLWFIVPFLLLIVHLVVQLFVYSPMYFKSVIMFFSRREIFIALFVFWLVLGAVLFLRKVSFEWAKPYLSFGVLILFLFGYFVRPRLFDSSEALNLVELGHWLSFIGVFAAVLGLVFLIWKERSEALLFFAITALIFAVFYIFDKRMNSRYPFSLRRYVPIVIPACCVFISYFFYYVNSKFKKAGFLMSVVLIPIIVVFPLYKCKSIVSAKDNKGWLKFWCEFAEKIDNNALYIVNDYRWTRPLSDIFGENVITFTKPAEFYGEEICDFANDQIKRGKQVFYISDSNLPYSLKVDFREIGTSRFQTQCIEDALTFPPRIKQQNFDFKIYKVQTIGQLEKDEYVIEVGDENIGILSGFDKARMFSGMETTSRWTFKKAELVIPWLGDNIEQMLTIRACGMPKNAGESVISLYINDILVAGNCQIGENMQEYYFKIPPNVIDSGNKHRVTLTIRVNTWGPEEYGIKGYPDGLGILLDYIVLKRLDK